jgi:hypothetical protein
LLSPACHCKACLRSLALQVPAVEPGVLRPPAHRGWCLVQAPRWGASLAGGAVWGSQIGKIWTTNDICIMNCVNMNAQCTQHTQCESRTRTRTEQQPGSSSSSSSSSMQQQQPGMTTYCLLSAIRHPPSLRHGNQRRDQRPWRLATGDSLRYAAPALAPLHARELSTKP